MFTTRRVSWRSISILVAAVLAGALVGVVLHILGWSPYPVTTAGAMRAYFQALYVIMLVSVLVAAMRAHRHGQRRPMRAGLENGIGVAVMAIPALIPYTTTVSGCPTWVSALAVAVGCVVSVGVYVWAHRLTNQLFTV